MYYHHYGPGWIILALIMIAPFWRLCRRVGHSPWLSLLMFVPLANVILLYYIAFGDWPAQRGAAGTA
ncbi:MAG TPA: hypothetical protein VGF35_06560 [Steroidobacteraceae bacterium]|jgi:hypothetical protein